MKQIVNLSKSPRKSKNALSFIIKFLTLLTVKTISLLEKCSTCRISKILKEVEYPWIFFIFYHLINAHWNTLKIMKSKKVKNVLYIVILKKMMVAVNIVKPWPILNWLFLRLTKRHPGFRIEDSTHLWKYWISVAESMFPLRSILINVTFIFDISKNEHYGCTSTYGIVIISTVRLVIFSFLFIFIILLNSAASCMSQLIFWYTVEPWIPNLFRILFLLSAIIYVFLFTWC